MWAVGHADDDVEAVSLAVGLADACMSHRYVTDMSPQICHIYDGVRVAAAGRDSLGYGAALPRIVSHYIIQYHTISHNITLNTHSK